MNYADNDWRSESAQEIISRHTTEYLQAGVFESYKLAIGGCKRALSAEIRHFLVRAEYPIRARHVDLSDMSLYELLKFDGDTGRQLKFSAVGVCDDSEAEPRIFMPELFTPSQTQLIIDHAKEWEESGLHVGGQYIVPPEATN